MRVVLSMHFNPEWVARVGAWHKMIMSCAGTHFSASLKPLLIRYFHGEDKLYLRSIKKAHFTQKVISLASHFLCAFCYYCRYVFE